MDFTKILRELTQIHAPSGHEQAVADYIENAAAKFGTVTRQPNGNIIVHKPGTGEKKLMLVCHMDSAGMVLTNLEKDGQARLGLVGAIDNSALCGARVRFANGAPGLITLEKGADVSKAKVTDFYLDLVPENAKTGDTAVFAPVFEQVGDKLMCAGLDSAAGCAVLLAALEQMEKPDCQIYAVFAVQNHFGFKGVKTAAFEVEPDVAVVLGAVEQTGFSPGDGAGVMIMDKSVACSEWVADGLKAAAAMAERECVPYICETATPVKFIAATGSGAAVGALGFAVKHANSANQMVSEKDLQDCAQILAGFAGNV